MSNTKIRTKYDVVFAETLGSDFATTMTLATGGATIPANTGEILAFASAAAHWNPVGAATSSFMHAVAANEPFLIQHKHQATAQIIGDGGAVVVTLVYMRGSARQDSTTAQARPN